MTKKDLIRLLRRAAAGDRQRSRGIEYCAVDGVLYGYLNMAADELEQEEEDMTKKELVDAIHSAYKISSYDHRVEDADLYRFTLELAKQLNSPQEECEHDWHEKAVPVSPRTHSRYESLDAEAPAVNIYRLCRKCGTCLVSRKDKKDQVYWEELWGTWRD